MFDKKPGVYLTEEVAPSFINGGGKIPCFIAITTTTDSERTGNPEEVITATSKEDLYQQIINKHIVTDLEDLACKKELDEFYEEIESHAPDEQGVDKVYFIDVGAGGNIDSYKTALLTSYKLNDVDMIVLLGNFFTDIGTSFITTNLESSLKSASEVFDFRTAYCTCSRLEEDVNDNLIINFAKLVELSRVNVIEPNQYGKFIAKIAITPFWREAGLTGFNTVEENVFAKRTNVKIKEMMNAGIIVGLDEKVNDTVYTKINLAVSSNFSKKPQPADSILQTRLIADEFHNEVYAILYKYIKQNETATALIYMQSDIDSLIDNWIMKGYLKEGSTCTVQPSNDNPYYITVNTSIIPINSIIAIQNTAIIEGLCAGVE